MAKQAHPNVLLEQWRWERAKIRNRLDLGVSLMTAILHGVSCNCYWDMASTPALLQALSNDGLQAQGLLSIKTQWCRAQGYTA